MSIADQSKNPSSLLCRFLDAQLLNRSGVTDAWARSLEAAPWTGRDLADGWDHLGCALEVRIGLDLAARPAPWHLLSYLPAGPCRALLTAAGFRHEPVGTLPDSGTTDPALLHWVRSRQPPDAGEDGASQRQTLACCLDLVGPRDLAHKWRDTRSVEERRSWFILANEVHPLRENSALLDALDHAWTGYQQHGRTALRALGDPVLVAVDLAGGYGVADLVTGRTLIDIKVTAEPVRHLDQWLCQLLGYVLLDWQDTLRVDTIAIYAVVRRRS